MNATLSGPCVTAPAEQARPSRPRSPRRRARDSTPEIRARLAARDPIALQCFFELYLDRIRRFVRGLVRCEHLAEDLTQEVLLQLCESFDTYDPSRELEPWVLAVAKNKVRDHWRSGLHQMAAREVRLESCDVGPRLIGSEAGPELELEQRETARLVAEALAELPESMRRPLVLRYVEGLSFEELSVALGRSEVAVRKRCSRGLMALREKLAAGRAGQRAESPHSKACSGLHSEVGSRLRSKMGSGLRSKMGSRLRAHEPE